MPLKIIGVARIAECEKKVDSQLSFHLDQCNVEVAVQQVLYDGGIFTMRRFANLEDDKTAVRKVLKDDFEMDGADGLEMRNRVSDVLDAWDEAKDLIAKKRELRAENKATALPQPTGSSEHRAMRKAYEKAHGK